MRGQYQNNTLEHFYIERRKTKTKETTTANQKEENALKNQWKLSHWNRLKRGKTRVTKS